MHRILRRKRDGLSGAACTRHDLETVMFPSASSYSELGKRGADGLEQGRAGHLMLTKRPSP